MPPITVRVWFIGHGLAGLVIRRAATAGHRDGRDGWDGWDGRDGWDIVFRTTTIDGPTSQGENCSKEAVLATKKIK